MRRLLVCLAVCLFAFSCSSLARAQDTGLDLMLQVQRLQQWLAPSPYAEGWRRFLLLNQLESQAVKAWRGDPNTITAILRQFESGHPGLEHPVFDGVRQALRNHARQLPLTNGDIEAALNNAPSALVPITQERLKSEFGQLKNEVLLCKNRYSQTLPSDQAAAQFAELRFDELLAVADGIDLALAQPASKKQTDDLRTLRSILLLYNERSMRQRDRFFPLVRRQLERAFLQYGQWLQANPQAEFEQHLAKLKSHLAEVTDSQKRTAQGELALELGWLDATGHAPQLVAAVRARHMQPNVRFLVAESLAQKLASRPVNNNRPVNEVILGRQIYGDATTNGLVRIDFVEDPNQAHVSIHMQGITNSNSHTHQGPITAYAGSVADIEVRRSIMANVGGLIEFAPYAAANLNSEFRGVNCIRLVEKFAYKEYLKDKNASEAIGARRMEQKLLNEFRTESDNTIRQAKVRLADAQSKNDSRLAMIPAMYVRTTNDFLLGFGLKTETFQLSAPTYPPAAINVPADLVLQVHESMLDNYVEPVLARQTIKNTEFGAKFKEWFGELPEGLAEPASDEVWGITFAQSRPVQFIFENNRFGIAISGSKFTRDEEFRDRDGLKKTRVKETIDEPMMIKIMFLMQRTNGQLALVRDGRATVEFTREGVKTVPKNAFRSFLEDVLNKNLREQEDPQAQSGADNAAQQSGISKMKISPNLIPIERLQDPTVAQNLELVVFRSEVGWITAAWRYSPNSQVYSQNGTLQPRILGPIDLPAVQDFVPPPAPAN